MVLHWMRENLKFKLIREIYGVSDSFISRTIHHVMPILAAAMQFISWPKQFVPLWNGISGAIDCTSHFRWRVHPRQADWYRGDKHGFFINAQVCVSLSGRLWNVTLGLGHNNDQGMLILTEMKDFLRQHNLTWVADNGYHFYRLEVPNSSKPEEYNNLLKGYRSVVETVIGLAKVYATAGGIFRLSPELQELVLLVVYQFTGKFLMDYPLRPALAQKEDHYLQLVDQSDVQALL